MEHDRKSRYRAAHLWLTEFAIVLVLFKDAKNKPCRLVSWHIGKLSCHQAQRPESDSQDPQVEGEN